MPVPQPTSWPTVFTWATVSPIADWLNEPILAARAFYNAHWGTSFSSELEWQTVYLPKYPSDGWLRYGGGIPDFQIIGPTGVRGFGLHEFQGHPEIVERINAMNLLASASGGVTQPPAPPAEGDTPVPVDYPGAPPLGPGDVVTPPPGTPDPNSPPMTPPPTAPADFDITCEFTGRAVGTAVPVLFEDVMLFRLPATGKIEVVVKRADVPLPNFFIGSLTDVGFTLKVTRKSDGQTKTYIRPEGKPVEALLYFS